MGELIGVSNFARRFWLYDPFDVRHVSCNRALVSAHGLAMQASKLQSKPLFEAFFLSVCDLYGYLLVVRKQRIGFLQEFTHVELDDTTVQRNAGVVFVGQALNERALETQSDCKTTALC